MNMKIKRELEVKEEYEFSVEEREELCTKFKLSLLDSQNHPLPPEIKDKAFRAVQEQGRLDKLFNHINVQAKLGQLNELCKVKDIASDVKDQYADPLNPLESMLVDQMTAIHKASMSLLGNVFDEDGFDFESGEKLINLSNKLMKAYQAGLQTLNQVRNSGKQTIVVKHQNVQVNGGQAIVATEVNAPEFDRGVGGKE
jgi:hypothetical protein